MPKIAKKMQICFFGHVDSVWVVCMGMNLVFVMWIAIGQKVGVE